MIRAILFSIVSVLAIIFGAYFGTRHEKKSKPNKPLPTSSSNPDSGGSNRPTGDPSSAFNGTALASISYDAFEKYSADTTGVNYVLFYQHSNGHICRLIYNQTRWYPSELISKNARLGTGLSAVWFGAPPIQIYIYYIDQDGYLQELRGSHASSTWTNGTLGAARFKAVDTYSTLSANYQGKCGARGNIGWVHFESKAGIQEALWNHDADSWTQGANFTDLKTGTDIVTTIDKSEITAWRVFGVNKNNFLQEYVCKDCCDNASRTYTPGKTLPSVETMMPLLQWNFNSRPGLTATTLPTSSLTLGGASVDIPSSLVAPRLLYYLGANSSIHELNNTDFPTPHGLIEGWVKDPSSRANGANTGTLTNFTQGLDVKSAMPGSRLSMTANFKGLVQSLWLFYQSNGTNVMVTTREADKIGEWTVPSALPVGI